MSGEKPSRVRRWLDVILPAMLGAAFTLNGVLTLMGKSDPPRPALAIALLVMAALFFGQATHRLWRLRRESKAAV